MFFAAWDAKQETLGFTQFELVYGHLARGPLKLINYSWLDKANSENLFTYVGRVRDKATELARSKINSVFVRNLNHGEMCCYTFPLNGVHCRTGTSVLMLCTNGLMAQGMW